MNSTEILNKLVGLISKKGLARDRAHNKGAYCLAASLVESATFAGKFWEKEYTIARNRLCMVLGIGSSYAALADYNDDWFTSKRGEKVYRNSTEHILEKVIATANLPEVVGNK